MLTSRGRGGNENMVLLLFAPSPRECITATGQGSTVIGEIDRPSLGKKKKRERETDLAIATEVNLRRGDQ